LLPRLPPETGRGTLPLTTMSGPGKRVLLVDDNEDARELLGGLLEMQGYQIEVSGDAPEALEIAARWQPQIIVLDLGLPGIDGWELARQLRQLDGLAQVRIIALTGYGSERDRDRSREAGIDTHLLKPVEISQLVRAFT
jgi:CheY-like chemotaxis protein